MSIETEFDIRFIATMALKEKQIQQNYRPIIAVHKWFARRPGTLFRGLVLAEFDSRPVTETFFESNHFPGKMVADPFMGGGIPLLEANRVGCDVVGFDINPMATWIVREEIEYLNLSDYCRAAKSLVALLDHEIGAAYRTTCVHYGDVGVPVKYFLWVKVLDCEKCGLKIDLFPSYLLADDTRHPMNVLVCAHCGELNETTDTKHAKTCFVCNEKLVIGGPARHNRCNCSHCGHLNKYPRPSAGPLGHRLFAIEYFNPHRKHQHAGRFFKKPDDQDLDLMEASRERWNNTKSRFVPDDSIPAGDETDRLHRWGYVQYKELFNERQLLGLELSCRLIAKARDQRVRHALATNLSDLLRYQNMLCRYDTMALKSLDIFSVHGFPVGLVHCESNLLGITNESGGNVGSGGWGNIIDKYARAKRYCEEPFETRTQAGRKVVVPIPGEWIGEKSDGARDRSVELQCISSTNATLKANSLDAVFTDPPYFGNVQYSELMDFCYVWLRKLMGPTPIGFDRQSTRDPNELTGNITESRGMVHFTDGLAMVYKKMQEALKPGAPLAFTFHHNRIETYHAVGVAILDAELWCNATLPCPAEMGGSIHIRGTGSSIVDTVFVCRKQSPPPYVESTEIVELIRGEISQLRLAGLKPTHGDIRCIVYGHLTRLTIAKLYSNWDRSRSTQERLDLFASTLIEISNPGALIAELLEFSTEDVIKFKQLVEVPSAATI